MPCGVPRIHVTENDFGLDAVPTGVTTVIGPVVAPDGTEVTILVALSVEITAGVPLKLTLVAPERLIPLIVTEVPTGPELGEKLLMVGAVVRITARFAVKPPAQHSVVVTQVMSTRS